MVRAYCPHHHNLISITGLLRLRAVISFSLCGTWTLKTVVTYHHSAFSCQSQGNESGAMSWLAPLLVAIEALQLGNVSVCLCEYDTYKRTRRWSTNTTRRRGGAVRKWFLNPSLEVASGGQERISSMRIQFFTQTTPSSRSLHLYISLAGASGSLLWPAVTAVRTIISQGYRTRRVPPQAATDGRPGRQPETGEWRLGVSSKKSFHDASSRQSTEPTASVAYTSLAIGTYMHRRTRTHWHIAHFQPLFPLFFGWMGG